MRISVTDEKGNPLVGAEVKVTISVSCVGYQTMLKTVDTIYNPNQQDTLKLSLVEDSDLQRYFISNELAQLFDFKDSSELPKHFCGLIIARGDSQGKDMWLSRVNHLPNSVIISFPKMISEQLLSLEVAQRQMRQTVEVMARNGYQFIVVDAGLYNVAYNCSWHLGEIKITEKIFEEKIIAHT